MGKARQRGNTSSKAVGAAEDGETSLANAGGAGTEAKKDFRSDLFSTFTFDSGTMLNLVGLTAIIGSVYMLYLSYFWVHLQSGFIRPRVLDDGLRQVLIVGTQSSGTSQLAAGLATLGLEVEHEYSDTNWAFARDGTVSWFHGLRFLPGKPSFESIGPLCSQWHRNVGFHPAMYRSPRRGCSYRVSWSQCWTQECVDILFEEWGCGLRGTCETPYRNQLFLTRHPLRTMESLGAKFCLDFSGGLERVNPTLAIFASSFFPDSPVTPKSTDCLEVVGWYVVLYIEAMLQALESGAIDGMISVEKVSPCDVATAAGFLNESSAVYQPSSQLARDACLGNTKDTQPKEQEVKNRRNKGRVKLGFGRVYLKNLQLFKRLKAIAKRLGYEDSDQSDEDS